ncbi:MAG: hypothetical protein RLY70_3243 [Planctomycetota bacterium]
MIATAHPAAIKKIFFSPRPIVPGCSAVTSWASGSDRSWSEAKGLVAGKTESRARWAIGTAASVIYAHGMSHRGKIQRLASICAVVDRGGALLTVAAFLEPQAV